MRHIEAADQGGRTRHKVRNTCKFQIAIAKIQHSRYKCAGQLLWTAKTAEARVAFPDIGGHMLLSHANCMRTVYGLYAKCCCSSSLNVPTGWFGKQLIREVAISTSRPEYLYGYHLVEDVVNCASGDFQKVKLLTNIKDQSYGWSLTTTFQTALLIPKCQSIAP